MCDIEHQRCNITERVIIAICSKFSVNEEWLRTGFGEMFVSEDKDFNQFFEVYKTLSKPLQDFLIQTAQNLLDLQNKF